MNYTEHRKLARGAVAQGTVRALSLAALAGELGVAARLLRPAAMGAYLAAVAILSIAAAFGEFGIQQTGVLMVGEGLPAQDMYRAALVLSARMGVGALLASGIVALALPHGVLSAFLILAPSYLLSVGVPAFSAVAQAQVELGRLVWADLVGRLAGLTVLCSVLPFARHGALPHAMAVIAVASLVGAAVSAALLWPRELAASRASAPTSACAMGRRAAPLGLTNALSYLHVRVDQIMLAAFGLLGGLAAYGVAYRVIDGGLAILASAGLAVLPLLARSTGSGRVRTAAVVNSFMTIVGFVGGGAVFVLAPQLTGLLGAGRYPAATWLLRLLCPAVMAAVSNTGVSQTAIVSRRLGSLAGLASAAIVINLTINVALIPIFGPRASAVATSATETMGVLLVCLVARRALPGCTTVGGTAAAMVGFVTATFGTYAAVRSDEPLLATVICAAGIACGLGSPFARLRRALRWPSYEMDVAVSPG